MRVSGVSGSGGRCRRRRKGERCSIVVWFELCANEEQGHVEGGRRKDALDEVEVGWKPNMSVSPLRLYC